MGGVCVACNAPVEEEVKETCPDCPVERKDEGEAEASSEAPAEGGDASVAG